VGRGMGVTLGAGVADGVGVDVSVAVGLGACVGVGAGVEMMNAAFLSPTYIHLRLGGLICF
jgi:hypothetical protein